MSHNDRDITRDFLRGVIVDDDNELLKESKDKLSNKASIEIFSHKVESIFANRAEELGYFNIPISAWAAETSRLNEVYRTKNLTLDESINDIRSSYLDEYIDDVASLYEAPQNSSGTKATDRTITREFLSSEN